MAAVETSDPREDLPLAVAEDAQVISVTDRAARMFGEILVSKGVAQAGLKIAVVGGGCSGNQYSMAVARQPEKTDIVTEANGIQVYLDGYTAHLLVGAEIDFVDSMMGRGFTVRNPNAKGTCGCGSSFNTTGEAPKAGGCGTCST